MIALRDNPTLDSILTEIFTNERSILIGFSFKSDLDVFAKCLPRMNFYRYMTNFVDAQTFYSKVAIAA